MDSIAHVCERIRGRTKIGRHAEPRNQNELSAVRAADNVRVQRHPVHHGDHHLAGQLVLLFMVLE